MKLPANAPFVVLDNPYAQQPVVKLQENFLEWIVRDCAKVRMCLSDKQEILKRYGLEP